MDISLASKTYAALMGEAKARLAVLDEILKGSLSLTPNTLREFAHLQLRMLCEIVALGCLVAHGDVVKKDDPDLETKWNANEIIKRLSKLHPKFYPFPVNQEIHSAKKLIVTGMASGHLTKPNS